VNGVGGRRVEGRCEVGRANMGIGTALAKRGINFYGIAQPGLSYCWRKCDVRCDVGWWRG
jgi:hypothetical protein